MSTPDLEQPQTPRTNRRPEPVVPLRVALVGAGAMARHHARAIARVEGASVVGVADPDPEARGEVAGLCPGAKGFPDLKILLSELRPDVAHICTPPSTHGEMALLALEAGAHVYVEKPFAETVEEAQGILGLAGERNLQVCAGHQLLYEDPSRRARDLLPALGDLVHVESYFAFRASRMGKGDSPAPSAELQLLDILPHPVYVLLQFLEEAEPKGETRLEAVQVGKGGTVHGLVRRGRITGTLVVTLAGRPVESYLRLVGSNGTVQADYVRSTVQRAIGPGSSGIDKALQPYRLARQLLVGTTASLSRRVLKRQKSYPGLVETFEAFYSSVQWNAPPPVTPNNILETVRICETVAAHLKKPEPCSSGRAAKAPTDAPRVLVTGGTGFLGKEVVSALRERDCHVRVLARRLPPPWSRDEGVEYMVADLAEGLPSTILEGVTAVVHCASETAGGWDAHERNSLRATENMIRSAARTGVGRFIHVSSMAVVDGTAPLSEQTPLITGKDFGPYAWGKAESERLAQSLGDDLGLEVAVVRPGAIVDWRAFEPPGRLGRRLGNLFVAVGSGKDTLGVVGVQDVARLMAWMAMSSEAPPRVLNVVDPDQPTKSRLIQELRKSNPDLRVVWLPRFFLLPLSGLASLAQKVLRPGRPSISVAKVFSPRKYDASAVQEVWMRRDGVGEGR